MELQDLDRRTGPRYEHGFIQNPLAGRSLSTINDSLPTFLRSFHLDDKNGLPLDLLQRAVFLIKKPRAYRRQLSSSTDVQPSTRQPPVVMGSETDGVRAGGTPFVAEGSSSSTRTEANGVPSASGNVTTDDSALPNNPLKFTWEDYEQEEPALRREKAGSIKSLTKDMIVILVTCAFAAILQGWAQENIVGANVEWPIDLDIARKEEKSGEDFDIIYDVLRSSRGRPDVGLVYFGLVNAIPYFTAALFGLFFDPISTFYGRRGALLVAAILSVIGPLGAAYSTDWIMLMVFRSVQGMGMGAKAATVPVFESEVVAPKMRGKLLVLWQTFVAVGILLGAVANYIFKESWRAQLGMACVPAFHLLCLCYIIPESPRWLIKKGRYREAYQVLKGLRETPLQAARDLYLVHIQQRVEMKVLRGQETTDEFIVQIEQTLESSTRIRAIISGLKFWLQRFWELFTIRRNFRAVLGASSVMIAQQFCGINVFVFLTTTVLTKGTETLYFKMGFAGTMVVFSGSAYFLVGLLGRRSVMLSSLMSMFVLLLVAGYFLDRYDVEKGSMASFLVPIFIFMAVYSPGAGAIPFMYSSEVFGQTHREAGMSVAVFCNLALAGALAMGVPLYEHKLEEKNLMLLGIFAALDAVAIILVWIFMRTDSEAAALEDMHFLFLPETKQYIYYHVDEVLPYYLCKIISFGQYERRRKSFSEWMVNAGPGTNRIWKPRPD